MIQRIQTIFLLGTALVTGLMFFLPAASIIVPENATYDFFTSKVIQHGEPPVFITWNYTTLILNAVVTALALATIFIRRRGSKSVKPTLFLQFRLCAVNIILQLGLLGLTWYQVYRLGSDLQASLSPHLSFIFPLVGIIFTWLAMRGITKDITLLKSFDRIR